MLDILITYIKTPQGQRHVHELSQRNILEMKAFVNLLPMTCQVLLWLKIKSWIFQQKLALCQKPLKPKLKE